MSKSEEPRRYGKCRIEKEIGRGARATVYLARHEGLQIPVAVKVMSKEGAEGQKHFTERFLREARLTAQLKHDNIMRVYDCGQTQESYYLVLEYVDGKTCRDTLSEKGVFEWRSAVQIVRQVAEGLRYANTKGIIHRDLKPENVMIDGEGNVHIADMGLAKQVAAEQVSATADGDVLGTPYYMSPEQVRQPGTVDFRSDIYSLGATLYHMATGYVPFDATTPFEVMTKHLSEKLTPPEKRKPDLPPALCALIVRAMAKEPHDRYQSYEEMLEALDGLLAGETEAEPTAEAPVEVAAEAVVPSEEQAVELQAPAEEPVARPLPISPTDLPVTAQNVQAKVLGMAALLAYAFFLVCLYQLLLGWGGLAVALAALAGLVGLSVGWGYCAFYRSEPVVEAEASQTVDQQISGALGRLCERLGLPLPRVRVTDRRDDACYAYSLFSSRAAIHIPAGWLKRVYLSRDETEAFLAQSLAGVYNGDSDLRMLLAVPVGLLTLARWLAARSLGVIRSDRSRLRLWLAQGMVLAGMVGICAIIAALFFLSFWAGAVGFVFFGMLILVSAFERYSRHAGDAFAVKVMEGGDLVKSVIVASGVVSLEGYRLLREAVGERQAEQWSGETVLPDARGQVVESIASYYSEMEYAPNTLDTARKLFGTVPLAAERLNRLAGLPRRVPALFRVLRFANRVYTALLGVRAKQAMNASDLGAARLHAGLGAIAGALAVASVVALYFLGSMHYAFFLVVVAALGGALGFVVARQVFAAGPSAARLAWPIVLASVFFVFTSMLGFCLAGPKNLSLLANQFHVSFAVVFLSAAAAAALFVRVNSSIARARKAGAAADTTQGPITAAKEEGSASAAEAAVDASERAEEQAGEEKGPGQT